MKAVVLAGGEGTRLRPLTWTTPKQMLPIAGVPMIERVVAHLVASGIDDVVLSLGYQPDAFIESYPRGIVAGARLVYAVEPGPLDTAGAIRFAATQAGVAETFVAVNGDVLCDIDVGALVALHRARRAAGTIALTPVEDPSAFGVVPTGTDGRVIAFIEKPARKEAPTNLINAGIYVLEPSVLARIPRHRRASIEREVFPALAAGGDLYALGSDAYWIDTGTPEAYITAQHDILSGQRSSCVPPAPGAREVRPGVWVLGSGAQTAAVTPCSLVGAGARIDAGARVKDAVVAPGVAIARRAVVTGSVLLEGSVVEEGAVVADSIVGPGAVISRAAQVTDVSVVGAGTVVAAGAAVRAGRVPDTEVVE